MVPAANPALRPANDSGDRAPYTGRFAPSPTGPLHFGSLLAAVASFLEARVRAGRWLVRIEDIDPPREQPGAADDILRTLEAYAFEWHGEALRQSRNKARHDAAIERLFAAGQAYRCRCTRAILKRTARSGEMGFIYPGHCRGGGGRGGRAIRVLTDDTPVAVEDRLQGMVIQRLESELGDFIVRRRDGLVAYQLAVVVDDAADGVTDVVRGIDLLDSTPRQIHLQRLLELPTPGYLHIPIVVDANGEKLSKQTGAEPVSSRRPGDTLWRALAALRQNPPAALSGAAPRELWQWAQENWRPQTMRGLRRIGGNSALSAMQQNGIS